MADEESKLFSLREAERLRTQIEPILIETIESRRKLAELEEQLGALAERIQRSGGLIVSYETLQALGTRGCDLRPCVRRQEDPVATARLGAKLRAVGRRAQPG